MSEPIILSSLKNQQVKDWRALNKSREERSRQGIFLAEGEHMAMEALKTGKACALLVCDTLTARYAQMLSETRNQGIQTYLLPESVMNALSDAKTPQGVIAVCKLPAPEPLKSSDNEILVALDDVQDPGNVGTIIRTAEGAGVTGIIMSRGTADIFNPKTIRSTMGSIYRMPFLIVDDAVGFVKGLKARKICTYAAHLHGVHSYREEDYTKGTAFLIGNEGNGLTDAMAEAAECLIRIPMEGKVESLNAAIASAVLMYEAHGQRA